MACRGLAGGPRDIGAARAVGPRCDGVDRPRAAAAAPGFAGRSRRAAGWPRTPRPGGRHPGATGERTPAAPGARRRGTDAPARHDHAVALPGAVSPARRPDSAFLHAEPPTPLRAPTLEDLAAPFRRHALAEAVRFLPPAPVGLVGALHGILLGGDGDSPAIIPPVTTKSRGAACLRRASRRCLRGCCACRARAIVGRSHGERVVRNKDPAVPTDAARPGSRWVDAMQAKVDSRLSTPVDNCVCNS